LPFISYLLLSHPYYQHVWSRNTVLYTYYVIIRKHLARTTLSYLSPYDGYFSPECVSILLDIITDSECLSFADVPLGCYLWQYLCSKTVRERPRWCWLSNITSYVIYTI
jgi:hypothetical protein